MLKTMGSYYKPAPSRNNGSRLASNRNNDSRLVFEKNNGNGKIDRIGGNGIKHVKKSRKLKGKKLAKSRKSFKSKSIKSKKLSKNRNSPNFDATKVGPSFLTFDAKAAFNCLRLAFTKALILWHFDPKCHIWIEIDASGYAIDGMLSQLTFWISPNGVVTKADLGYWHPVLFFSRKMIPAKTWYKTHDGKLLAIIEAFKTWHHYLKGCKHEVLIFINHNNLYYFIDIKSLSS